MRFKRNSLFMAVSLALLSGSASAQIVTPVFSGTWFMDALGAGQSNCGVYGYTYSDGGNNRESVALAYVNKYSPETGCTWTIKSYRESDPSAIISVDFPGGPDYASESRVKQWQLATTVTPNAIVYTPNDSCVTPSGLEKYHTTGALLYPHYICPPGSVNGFDVATGEEGCTTTPRLCAGDVVGRDLKDAAPLGHVGLTEPAMTVIQVMNKDDKDPSTPLIHYVSFADFKNADTYWGDKYGLPEMPNFTYQQGQDILKAVATQDTQHGIYELAPVFTPLANTQISVYNQMTKQWQLQDDPPLPVFRCDTFVDWIYYQALGQKIIPFKETGSPWPAYKTYEYENYGATPKDLYSALLNTRDNALDSKLNQRPLLNKISSEQQEISNSTSYLLGPNITRDTKIQYYWQQLNNNPKPLEKSLAFDGLMFLAPTHLIPDFINKFNSDPQDQDMYLHLIIAAMQVKPQYVSSNDLSAIVAGQNFLAEQAQSQTNPDLLSMAIYGYNATTPYSEAKATLTNTAMNRLAQIKNIDPKSLYIDQFMLDVNDPSGNSLNHLIGNMKDSQYKNQFNQFLTGQIQSGLTATMLAKPNEAEISGYLLQQIQQIKMPLLGSGQNVDSAGLQEVQNYDLLKAYGSFTNNPNYVANAILNETNPNLQASLVMFALSDPWATQTHAILKAQKQALIQHLSHGQDPSGGLLSADQTKLPFNIQTAINNLNQGNS